MGTRKAWRSAAVVFALFALATDWLWIRHGSLKSLLALTLLALVLLGRLAWPRPSIPAEAPLPSRYPATPNGRGIFSIGLALYLGYWAFKDLYSGHWLRPMGLALLSGLLVRRWIPAPTAKPSRWLEIGAILLVLAGASSFRLWKLGDAPAHFPPPPQDEAFIFWKARMILDGERQTFAVRPGPISEGALPFYLGALSIKWFGDDLRGFRTVNALLGILSVLLVAAIGREMAGSAAGILSAGLMATATWPVAFSRANYLANETLFLFLAAFAFLLWGYRHRRGWIFVVSGAFFGGVMNAYEPGQFVPALIVAFLLLYYWLDPESRPLVKRSLFPLFAGFLIGITPLLLWASKDFHGAMRAYFAYLQPGGHTMGADSKPTMLATLPVLWHRLVKQLPYLMTVFTTSGPTFPIYIPGTMPLLTKALGGLCLAGFAGLATRKRNIWLWILPFWILWGVAPAAMGNIGDLLKERRVVLALPAFFLLAGMGLSILIQLGWRILRGRSFATPTYLSLLGLIASILLVPSHWDQYFDKVIGDRELLKRGRVNSALYCKAVDRLSREQPIRMLSYRLWAHENWNVPHLDPGQVEFIPLVPLVWQDFARLKPEWFNTHGLLDMLGEDPGKMPDGTQRIWAVSLTPFDFYLLPLLRSLGETDEMTVENYSDRHGTIVNSGMLADPKIFGIVVRMKKIDPARLAEAKSRFRFKMMLESLADPPGIRPSANININEPEFERRARDYWSRPWAWKVLSKKELALPDPWFWDSAAAARKGMPLPFRLKAHFNLKIEKAGTYAFGASSSYPIRLRLNNALAFSMDLPPQGSNEDRVKTGFMGKPMELRPGTYRLDISQFVLTTEGRTNHLLRLMWQPPGADAPTTLPIEVLWPVEN